MSIKSMMYMAMMLAAAASEVQNGKRKSGISYTDLGDYKRSNTQIRIKPDTRTEKVFVIKGKEIKAYSKKDALKRYSHKYGKK